MNYDSNKPETVFHNGRCIGQLMPRASQATLENSPGVQTWSRPGGVPKVRLFDGGASIAKFSEYWERHYGSTYPLAKTGRE